MNEWISVKERLPEVDSWVLTYSSRTFKTSYFISKLNCFSTKETNGNQFKGRYKRTSITHWMPLPEPPKP